MTLSCEPDVNDMATCLLRELLDGHEDAFGKVVDLAAQFGSGVGLLSVDFGRKGGYLFGVRGDGVSGKKFLVGGFHPERVIRRGGEAFREYR